MKLPSFKRIFKTDYEAEYQTLVERLAGSINIGFDSLYDALNKRLTFRDNIASTVKDIIVTVDAAGKPKATTSFAIDVVNPSLDGVFVMDVENLENAAIMPTAGVFVKASLSNSNVIISYIGGLLPNVSYRLRIVAILK